MEARRRLARQSPADVLRARQAAVDAFKETAHRDLVNVVAELAGARFDPRGETVYCDMLEGSRPARFYVVRQGDLGFSPADDGWSTGQSRGVTQYACAGGVSEYIYFGSIALRESGEYLVTIQVDGTEESLVIPPETDRGAVGGTLAPIRWSGDRVDFKLYSLMLPKDQRVRSPSPEAGRSPRKKEVRETAKARDVIWLGVERAHV